MKGQVKESLFKEETEVEFEINKMEDIDSFSKGVERIKVTMGCWDAITHQDYGKQEVTLPVYAEKPVLRNTYFEPFVSSARESGVISDAYDTNTDFNGAKGKVKLVRRGQYLNANNWVFYKPAPNLPVNFGTSGEDLDDFLQGS
ncbi:hypothetical protein [Latilactobacillus sakei]|uniref:hypothetical protein n=1 Tax=Latilactobacillus sakei TaxID=1599 RepID=UPI003F53BEEE